MTAGTRRKGFLAGALGGLALALLLVGAASVLPHSTNPLQAASAPAATETVFAAASTTTTLTSTAVSTSVSMEAISVSTSASGAVAAAVTSASTTTATTTTTVVGPAGKAPVSPAAVPGVQAASATATVTTATGTVATTVATSAKVAAAQRPSSLLAVLPGEGLGTILVTVSPLVFGLLIAALVYGAYTRRQDSS